MSNRADSKYLIMVGTIKEKTEQEKTSLWSRLRSYPGVLLLIYSLSTYVLCSEVFFFLLFLLVSVCVCTCLYAYQEKRRGTRLYIRMACYYYFTGTSTSRKLSY